MNEFATGVILAVIAQAGLLIATWQQRRKSKAERDTLAVDVMQEVNAELRIELTRIKESMRNLEDDNVQLDAKLRIAQAEARSAHETAGRALRRVEVLEGLLRAHSIPFDGGG